MRRSELLVGRKEAQRHPEIPELSVVSALVLYPFLVRFPGDRPTVQYRSVTKNVNLICLFTQYMIHRAKSARDGCFPSRSTVSYLKTRDEL